MVWSSGLKGSSIATAAANVAAAAEIQSLAWDPPYAMSAAFKKKKQRIENYFASVKQSSLVSEMREMI